MCKFKSSLTFLLISIFVQEIPFIKNNSHIMQCTVVIFFFWIMKIKSQAKCMSPFNLTVSFWILHRTLKISLHQLRMNHLCRKKKCLNIVFNWSVTNILQNLRVRMNGKTSLFKYFYPLNHRQVKTLPRA